MKARLQSIDHNRGGFIEKETYIFIAMAGDKNDTNMRIEISRDMFPPKDAPMIRIDMMDWDYDIEVKITAKPKEQVKVIDLK